MAKVKSKKVIVETEAHFGYVKGTSKWAKILEVGEYGSYEVDLYPDEEVLNEHIELFEKLRGDGLAEVEAAGKKVAGIADVFKTDDEGKRYLKLKLKELDFEGNPQKPNVFDVGGNDVTDTWTDLIGNGSLVKVKYMAKPYYMASTKMVGISLRMYAIQVIKLEEYVGGDSGFNDETSEDEPF